MDLTKRPFKKLNKKRSSDNQDPEQVEISRIKMPWKNQTFGIVEQRLGGSRMRVRCLDGKTRICRIPGRLKRTLWVREGNIVIAEPWELCGDEKGDILYKYNNTQVAFLKREGHLKALEGVDEF
jgi:translation initiation factor 1A